jgi:hypothetical protein
VAEKKTGIKAQMRDEIKSARKTQRTAQATARMLTIIAKFMPADIVGVRLGYIFESQLADEWDKGREFVPRLTFKLTGPLNDKKGYNQAMMNLSRVFGVRCWKKHIWGSDNPEFYFEGLGRVPQVDNFPITIRMMMGHVVPRGCVIERGQQRRTWSTVSTGRRAYCGVRSAR